MGWQVTTCNQWRYAVYRGEVMDKISVDDVGFPVRIQNGLKTCGIFYLQDLTEYTSRDLLRWRGIARPTLDIIIATLHKHKLSLKQEVYPKSCCPDCRSPLTIRDQTCMKCLKTLSKELIEKVSVLLNRLEKDV